MLALAATNALGALLFGALYAAAATRVLSQGPFLLGLVVLFGLVTRLWVHVERGQARGRDALSRVGRAAMGLVAVLIGVPIAVLLPLFSLEAVLPPGEALAVLPLASTMALLLVALVLVVVVNLAGVLVLAGSGLAARLRRQVD